MTAATTLTNGMGTELPARQPDLHKVGVEENQRPLTNNPSPDDLIIHEQIFGAKKKMRIAILGAGMSGINFFKFAEERLENIELVCYEKNEDIGGTWLENRYPGCACDVPSVVYQFPWRMASWSKYYSHSPEIWQYLKMVDRENGFADKYIKFQHSVQALDWQDDAGQWTIVVNDLCAGTTFIDHADFIINGTGWNKHTDLKGKRVALLGAGSSAVQILPNIYDQASVIYTWIRSPIWITAGFAQRFAGKDGANFEYSDEQQELFKDSDSYKTYCKMIERELNQRFAFIINGSKAQQDAREFSINEMKHKLKNKPELLDKIMPRDFFVGCRRPTPGNGYLEALSGDKTIAYTQQLQRITETGFIDPQGQEHEVDVFICATGFDTSYRPRMPLVINGEDLMSRWKDSEIVPSYLSVGLANVPNYLIFGGAYCPSAHGSFFPLIQSYTDYALQVIEKMQIENIKSLRPKVTVTEHFLKHANSFLKRTAWTGPCSSWFKGGQVNGTPAIYPGSRLHFIKLLEKPRFEDFDIEYDDKSDMFSFFGNGFHICERDGSDITWYLGEPHRPVDESYVLSVMDGTKGVELHRP